MANLKITGQLLSVKYSGTPIADPEMEIVVNTHPDDGVYREEVLYITGRLLCSLKLGETYIFSFGPSKEYGFVYKVEFPG